MTSQFRKLFSRSTSVGDPVIFCYVALSRECAVLNGSVMSNSLQAHGLQPSRLFDPQGLSRQEYWSGLPCSPPGDLLSPRIEPRSPALQADSLPSELPGKSKNTGVGSLSLLQGIFLTQESNSGLLHCFLYQLSYWGGPCHEQPF